MQVDALEERCSRAEAHQLMKYRLFEDPAELPIPPGTPLSITNVARVFNVSRVRLWWYERLRLIRRRYRFGQGLVYGPEDCARIGLLMKARKAGLSVHRLAPLLRAANGRSSDQVLRRTRARCLDLMDQLEIRRQVLRETHAAVQSLYKRLSEKLPQ